MERILFINFGYSKTSYIISSYSKNEFKVEKVLCNPYLGGRNLDENILEHIIKEYEAKNNIDNFELNQKKKIDALDEISKARNKLSINEQSRIQITNFYKNNDLDMILSLSDLNYMISDKLDTFKTDLLKVIKGKENSIKFVQMAGEVMRTQILEKILKDNFNLSLEKNISIDECISIGGAISGFYFHNLYNKNENLFKNFYEYNYYNIYYSISDRPPEFAFKKGMIKDKEKRILLPKSQTIKIKFFYDENEVKFCLKNPVIIKYKINLNEPEDPFLIIDFSFKNPKIENKNKIQKDIDIKVVGGFLKYDKENEIKKIQEKLKEHKDFEKDYFDYSIERKNLSKKIYEIKNSNLLKPEDKENVHNQLDEYLNYLRKHEPDKKIRDEEIKKINNKLEEYNKTQNDKK
jgi:molecular chaperone DnaK (HSP70)